MNSRFNFRDFLTFDKMLAPSFLTILYYFHMGVVVLLCLGLLLGGLNSRYGGGMMVLGGLVGLVLGPLLVRLTYEFVIVLFKIHGHLASIDGKTGGEVGAVAISRPTMPPPVAPTLIAPVITPIAPPLPTIEPIGPPVAPPPPANPPKNFWSEETGQPVFLLPDTSADVQGALRKLHNVPLVGASLLVLIGVVSSYADVMGMSYSIKNSPMGMIALFGAIGMLVVSALGSRLIVFMGCYIAVLLGTILAYFDGSSYFQQMARGRGAIESAGNMANEFMPGLNQYTQQAMQNTPGPTQFLTITAYLFMIALLFCGYWALAGRYHEKTTSPT